MQKIVIKNLNINYGDTRALKDINLDIDRNEIMALIGPSGCGKSSLLRCINRMNDEIKNFKISGEIYLDGMDIYSLDCKRLRQKVGMVFQKPNPFAMSIFDNLAFGPRVQGISNKAELDEIIETALKKAALFDEVKDRLNKNALELSGGQQQRLCIARSIAIRPDVLLLDEPTSALDPISTAKIEELLGELKKEYTILMVTHHMHQARRISDRVAFFLNGELIETDKSEQIFNDPKDERTAGYINGRFG